MSVLRHATDEFLLASSNSPASEAAWFAIYTRPRFEKKVASQLAEKGVKAFLPLFSSKRQWSDRKRLVQSPLFPGYVFVRMVSTLESRISVLRTSGVGNFVGFRGTGTPIPDDEIHAVQAVLQHGVPIEIHPFFSAGRRVRIRGGSLDGIKGVLCDRQGDQSLVISVELIQKSIAMPATGLEMEIV